MKLLEKSQKNCLGGLVTLKNNTKLLGRGLDNLFDNTIEDQFFDKALKDDENGNYLFAFHYYMKVVELNGKLKAKALNNAAVILAENGFSSKAIELLKEALKIDSNNSEIKYNLNSLLSEAE